LFYVGKQLGPNFVDDITDGFVHIMLSWGLQLVGFLLFVQVKKLTIEVIIN
jgi:hypothetical protein